MVRLDEIKGLIEDRVLDCGCHNYYGSKCLRMNRVTLSEIIYPYLIDEYVCRSWEQSRKYAKTATEVKFWDAMIDRPKKISVYIADAINENLKDLLEVVP